jgi:hypothetical protein
VPAQLAAHAKEVRGTETVPAEAREKMRGVKCEE